MNRTYLFAAGLICYSALAQAPPDQQIQYVIKGKAMLDAQQAESLAAVPAIAPGGRGMGATQLRSEPGRPFSATVTTTTTQVLADGTRVNQTSVMLQYRDPEGRIRTESKDPALPNGPSTSITIRDTVAAATYNLDPATRTGVKLVAGGRGGRGGGGGPIAVAPAARRGSVGAGEVMASTGGAVAVLGAMTAEINQSQTEDLGTMNVNGVHARGTRITTTVPVGAIGNDREFKSVTERWFSPDLNLLVKSVSTDPRFGTTRYELTNISRQPPDPSLFQAPADYKLSDPAAGVFQRF